MFFQQTFRLFVKTSALPNLERMKFLVQQSKFVCERFSLMKKLIARQSVNVGKKITENSAESEK